jgi:type IV pilus assembly protein PilA
MKGRLSQDAGFTLLELVVVVAIIGILATLAIANYAVFKINAYNTTAAADCRNLAPAADFHSSQPSPTPLPLTITLTGAGGPVDPSLPGGTSSPGTLGTITFPEANRYTVKTYHSRGDLCFTIADDASMSISPGVCS